jgi:hypothetical protein
VKSEDFKYVELRGKHFLHWYYVSFWALVLPTHLGNLANLVSQAIGTTCVRDKRAEESTGTRRRRLTAAGGNC